MDTMQAYNIWAEQYDSNDNKTRDLEARALREILGAFSFERCLEIGCGTGKNTSWFLSKAAEVTAVDFSEEMLAKAREKIQSPKLEFIQADITRNWDFRKGLYHLVSFSLVLEHIEDLYAIFGQVADSLVRGGYVYLGELHPFKQYTGSKARFETEKGLQIVPCYNHHVSDFVKAGKDNGLELVQLEEYFDENDRRQLPRILVLVFRKP